MNQTINSFLGCVLIKSRNDRLFVCMLASLCLSSSAVPAAGAGAGIAHQVSLRLRHEAAALMQARAAEELERRARLGGFVTPKKYSGPFQSQFSF